MTEITYSFDEDTNVVPMISFDLFEYLNIKNNIVVNIFRGYQECINYSVLRNTQYEFFCDYARADNIYLFFKEIDHNNVIYESLLNDCYSYPTEIAYIPIKCDFQTFLKNFENRKSKDIIKLEYTSFISELYENILILRYDDIFYKEFKSVLKVWEKSLSLYNYKKTEKTHRILRK